MLTLGSHTPKCPDNCYRCCFLCFRLTVTSCYTTNLILTLCYVRGYLNWTWWVTLQCRRNTGCSLVWRLTRRRERCHIDVFTWMMTSSNLGTTTKSDTCLFWTPHADTWPLLEIITETWHLILTVDVLLARIYQLLWLGGGGSINRHIWGCTGRSLPLGIMMLLV